MKKHMKWVALFSMATILILGITAFGLGTKEKSVMNTAPTKETEVVQKETKSTNKAKKGEETKKEDAIVEKEVAMNKKSEQKVSTKDANADESREVKEADKPNLSTPDRKVITPSADKANVDAVSNYSTSNVVRNGTMVEMHVIADGSVEKLAQFVLPYAQMVKNLNSGVTDVQIKLYSSQQAFNQKKPSAEYKNGILTVL